MAAVQRAIAEIEGSFDAVASLGGETFLVYVLTDGRITNVLSHNKCAAGSGEFFVQQIGRMGLDLDEAVRLSHDGKVVPLASRCSVHCKSDVTHKLNRNEASREPLPPDRPKGFSLFGLRSDGVGSKRSWRARSTAWRRSMRADWW